MAKARPCEDTPTRLGIILSCVMLCFFAHFNTLACSPVESSSSPVENKNDSAEFEAMLREAKEHRGPVVGISLGKGQFSAAAINVKPKPAKGHHEMDLLFKEEVENYPEDEIRMILDEAPQELRDLFKPKASREKPQSSVGTMSVASSVPSDDEQKEEDICSTETRLITPRQVLIKDSHFYVPNTEDFKQIIEAEICRDHSGQCRYLENSLPYGVVSSCKQKYAYKTLLYLDENKLASDDVRYASSCSCVIEHVAQDMPAPETPTESEATAMEDSYTTEILPPTNPPPRDDELIGPMASNNASSVGPVAGQNNATNSG